MAAGTPASIPKMITQPRSAPSISATAIGPGVGGIKAWVIARPAKSGSAYNKRDFLVVLLRAYVIGTRMINATSKKTGMATKKPVKTMAQEAFSCPVFFSR